MQNNELKHSKEEPSKLYSHLSLTNIIMCPYRIFTLNQDGIICNVNLKGAELLQLGKKIIGGSFSKFIPKDNKISIIIHWKMLLIGGVKIKCCKSN